MIRINLLPYREEELKRRKRSFFALLILGGILGGLVVLLFAGFMAVRIADQNARNSLIKAENTKLDGQIKEVATLKDEIQALKARQDAVEDLQADRNQPVYLMNELVQQTPEGIYLKSIKQDGQRVALSGYAQSNERVAEYLRNLGNNSAWLQRPDLLEIRAATAGQGKDAKNVFEFSINVGIKRPRDKDNKDQQQPVQVTAEDVAKVAAGNDASKASSTDAAKSAPDGDKPKLANDGNGPKPPAGGSQSKASPTGDAGKPPANSGEQKGPAGGDPAKSSSSANAQKS